MQPEDRRRKLKATGLARARAIFKADLFWISGFPVYGDHAPLQWSCGWGRALQPERRVPVDGELLRRAEFAYTALVNRFPRATRRLVDEPDAWIERVPQLLAWLKDAVH